MATMNEPITDRAAAVAMLRTEHDRLAEMLRLVVDLLQDVQEGRAVRADQLRASVGHTIRKSIIEREAALAALSPDHDVAELVLAQILLDVITDADERNDDDIVELCQRRMPASIAEAVA